MTIEKMRFRDGAVLRDSYRPPAQSGVPGWTMLTAYEAVRIDGLVIRRTEKIENGGRASVWHASHVPDEIFVAPDDVWSVTGDARTAMFVFNRQWPMSPDDIDDGAFEMIGSLGLIFFGALIGLALGLFGVGLLVF